MLKILFRIPLTLLGAVCYFSPHLASAQTPGTCPSPIAFPNLPACYTDPDEKQLTINKIYLCTAQPGAPTTSSAINLAACVQVLSNSAGTPLTLNRANINPGVTPPGTFIRPPNATYSHVYLDLKPRDTITISKQFASVQTGTDGSRGIYCWSGNASTYAYSASVSTAASSCGNSANAGSAVTTQLNSLGGTGPFSATASFTNVGSLQNVNLNAYLMDAAYKLPASGVLGSMGTVVTLGAVFSLSAPLVVTAQMRNFGASYNYSWGAEVFSTNSGIFFSGGPPAFQFTAN
jgi:hypothetical protein